MTDEQRENELYIQLYNRIVPMLDSAFECVGDSYDQYVSFRQNLDEVDYEREDYEQINEELFKRILREYCSQLDEL